MRTPIVSLTTSVARAAGPAGPSYARVGNAGFAWRKRDATLALSR
ncbi:hypothetical protein [Nocardioides marmoribigeumensis]|uniref:Uncharacterized protein n=1 Tax=Nocardioides marmoribigeumensis TaxID=433649 RepID=A0ABU2BSJ7_9ACTN|nr:hypothetical protein [Nocardioides marmoribigeumensis]MDR7361608.1 hypothetical protein [Nocardioides marmoribigeumensis]